MGTVTSLTLDYVIKGNDLPVSSSESFYITMLDNFDIGNMTNGILGWVDDGKGFVPLRVGTGSTNLYFLMPDTESESSIDPNYIYLGTVTNSMIVTITNEGSGSGNITYARITLPNSFSNVHSIVSAHGADATYDSINSRIVLQYTNYLKVGDFDEVSFDYDSLYTQETNLTLTVETANLTNNPIYYNCPGEKGAYSTITVSYPPFAVESYFAGDYRLYLNRTNASLTYRLINRSCETFLTQATIILSTNVSDLFDSITLTSSFAKLITFDTNNNRFIVQYKTNVIKYGLYDDLIFSFKYNFDETFRFDLNTSAVCVNNADTLVTNLDALTLSTYKSYICVTNSTWGVLSGLVFPAIYAVNVKIYYPGTTISATNDSGEFLRVTSLSAAILHQPIPAGNYSISCAIITATSHRRRGRGRQINMVSTVLCQRSPAGRRITINHILLRTIPILKQSPSPTIETNKEFSMIYLNVHHAAASTRIESTINFPPPYHDISDIFRPQRLLDTNIDERAYARRDVPWVCQRDQASGRKPIWHYYWDTTARRKR